MKIIYPNIPSTKRPISHRPEAPIPPLYDFPIEKSSSDNNDDRNDEMYVFEVETSLVSYGILRKTKTCINSAVNWAPKVLFN